MWLPLPRFSRRRFRLTVRDLLALVALVAVGCGRPVLLMPICCTLAVVLRWRGLAAAPTVAVLVCCGILIGLVPA